MPHRNDSLLSKKVIFVWHWQKYLLLRAVTIYRIMKQILCHTQMTLASFIESHFCVALAEIFATAGGNNLQNDKKNLCNTEMTHFFQRKSFLYGTGRTICYWGQWQFIKSWKNFMPHRNDSLVSKKVISVWHWLKYFVTAGSSNL